MNQAPLNKNRNDKFILVLNLPDIVKEINDNVTRNNNRVNVNSLEMSVFGTLTPSIKIDSTTVPYGSQSIKVSSHARDAYEDITFDFKIDNEYRNYWVIYKWLDILNDVKSGIFNADNVIQVQRDQALKSYSSTFTVYGLDEYDNKKIQFNYVGAFPTRLTEINWNYGDNSEITASATFSFTRMEAELI